MVAIKASWPLRPPSTRAILAAFPSAQPSSGRWLRWLCPGHPPGRMMAGIQPSQPSAGGWLSLLYPDQAFQREMAERSRRQPSRTRVWWLAEREQSHLRSCRGRREGRVEFATAILRPNGYDGCMTAIMRPGGWQPGHSHRSHRPEDGCTGWMAAKMACAGRAEWLGSCNCSHAC